VSFKILKFFENKKVTFSSLAEEEEDDPLGEIERGGLLEDRHPHHDIIEGHQEGLFELLFLFLSFSKKGSSFDSFFFSNLFLKIFFCFTLFHQKKEKEKIHFKIPKPKEATTWPKSKKKFLSFAEPISVLSFSFSFSISLKRKKKIISKFKKKGRRID